MADSKIVQELIFILSAEELFDLIKLGGDFSCGFSLNLAVDEYGCVFITIAVAERKIINGKDKVLIREGRGRAVPTPPGGSRIEIEVDDINKVLFDTKIPINGLSLTQLLDSLK